MKTIDGMILDSLEAFIVFIAAVMIASSLILFAREAKAAPEDWLDSCAPYESTVKKILNEEGVSNRYYFLMVAESHCREGAISNKGAVGFWQMLPITDRHYGCRFDFDIECQTRAAAKYIKHIHKSFHSFEDVIAAYNMGGHNYSRASRKTSQAIGLIHTVLALENIANKKCAPRPSLVILDGESDCKYWYYMDEPQKLNPCENVPENAEPVWFEG